MHKKRLFQNTFLLTASSLVMRVIALVFQIWLIGRIGTAGIGLFQLVMSVGMLSSTVAVSGIRFASTRLVSEELGLERPGGVGRAMRRCMGYSLFFGCAAFIIMYLFAEPIGFLWIGDARTVRSLRVLALSMPFMSLASVFAGYFTAVGRVYKSALIQIGEQLFRIALVVIFLRSVSGQDIESSCFSVCSAGTLADILCFFMLLIAYVHDKRRHYSDSSGSPRLTARMLHIALPLALSAYARTSLSTLEHLLVPRELKAAGHSADSALSGYGTVHGMVFPIVLFPSCLLSALAEMLVPDLTEAQVSGQKEYISETVSSLLRKSLAFSCACALFLYCTADALGVLVYKSFDAGRYIQIFVPLIPIMYMDIVTDGCLKGLGQMMWSMAVNITDALCGVILVILLIPRFGLPGYIAVIYITETLNFILSIGRLGKITRLRLFPKNLKKQKKEAV